MSERLCLFGTDHGHQPDCPCRTCEHKRRDPEHCTGCLEREAEHGRLCPWHWQRLNGDVADAPHLVRHLYDEARPSAGRRPSDGRPGDPAERTVLHPATLAADGVHAALAAWALCILDEHPAGLHGPDERGTVRSVDTWHRRPDDELEPGEPRYEPQPAAVVGIRDPQATSRLVRWMLPLLPWCSEQQWADEMCRDVADVIRTTWARFPAQERARHIPGVRCPGCDRETLRFEPATPERHTEQVSCSRRECGRVYTRDDFGIMTRIVEWEKGLSA